MSILSQLRAQVTMYSVATSVLFAASFVLLMSDSLLSGSGGIDSGFTFSLAALSLSGACFFLVMGDRLGPWPALLLVASNAAAIVLFFTVLETPAAAVGVLAQVPVLALYLGAFLNQWLARFFQAAMLLIFGAVVIWDPFLTLAQFEQGRNVISVMVFTWLCLEAGIFVQKRFTEETHIDALTSVYNRRGLMMRADIERSRAERTGQPVCVAVIDLNEFKHVNDTSGHSEGDRVLKDVTNQWRSLVRETDVIARIGGDEFILLLPNTDLEGGRKLLNRLHRDSVHPWSWGVVEWNPREQLAVAIAQADKAMYRDKVDRKQSGKATA